MEKGEPTCDPVLRTMKLAHLSDLHFYRFPSWKGIWSKRLVGLTNLYIRGRIRHFNTDIAMLAIRSVIEDEPDGVMISGDLTALGSPEEFKMARQALDPLIARIPTVIVPGNHDYYTRGAASSHRIEEYFGDVIRTPGSAETDPTYPTLHLIGETALMGMNPSCYTVGASGRIDPREVERLEILLQEPRVAGRFKVLIIHYPLFNRGGKVTPLFWRRLRNRENLIAVLSRYPVDLVVHGHDHYRYSNTMTADNGQAVYLANAGSAGYARGSVKASYNLYEIEGKKLIRVTHKNFGTGGFEITYQGPPV